MLSRPVPATIDARPASASATATIAPAAMMSAPEAPRAYTPRVRTSHVASHAAINDDGTIIACHRTAGGARAGG
jgi:hypothetical protein